MTLAASLLIPSMAKADQSIVNTVISSSHFVNNTEVSELSSFDQREVACIALAVYHESRGQVETGQAAVAHTVLNRKRSPRFPDTMCGVVFQRLGGRPQYHFTAWSHARLMPREKASWAQAVRVAAQAFKGGRDPSGGATHFCVNRVARAYSSIRNAVVRLSIGAHTFYRPRGITLLAASQTEEPRIVTGQRLGPISTLR